MYGVQLSHLVEVFHVLGVSVQSLRALIRWFISEDIVVLFV